MVNVNKLKDKIVENGLTIEKLAKCFIKQFTIKMHQNNATNATKEESWLNQYQRN